ncbi:phenylalanine--tRNA ligase subunit beta [Oceanirhabdus sp. W0125-5]|uniref:phenylalanine--tRNA ligase subunit beta n=1 Tax=Oceanirhabdus sp. W0125-5 TaxID=2999116 RepID=UPI0022F2E01C|nr:phenylalanine--tRNA ligase subunit beta [Oceanirhabdus sp. W0125-5]WBW99410.1 phenylalanine--tRNA ligase subunit beta [Oceanirhabdus sp. W0125-5]
MKVPYTWLKDYVDINIGPQELGDKLTVSGSKVEEVIISGGDITKVVTGKIEKIEPHPEAERLKICSVNIGKEENIQIVTAADNMKENDIVPTALHGSTLAGGLKIKKGKLRGSKSEGMFCSEVELGLADEKDIDGLMILPADTPLGVDIKEVVEIESAVLDFEITSNRPDCLSIIGMARETAATIGTEYRMPELNYESKCSDNIEEVLKVEVKDELCKRYMARGIKNVKIQPSPKWMQDRLLDAGIRPINNIVDITNFVMVEMGQPMHAFDAREISSNTIVVEKGNSGEKFTTLDEIERTLPEGALCIKDGDRIVALAGIMGGLNSEVKEDTAEIYLECASFEPVNIRETSSKIALRTDASTKFEKELDPNNVETAMNRACYLIQELGAGDVMEGTIDVYNNVKESHSLEVDSVWVNNFLGTEIPGEDMVKYLNSLDMETTLEGDTLKIKVPTFRCDMFIKEDVAEEIARIYGYNKVDATIDTTTTLREPMNKRMLNERFITDVLINCGLSQSISYSFISPKVFDKILVAEDSELRNAVKIKNPLGEDYSIMRTTMIPSIMESLGRNYARGNEVVRLFETGKIYIPNVDLNKIPEERNIITIGMYGECDFFTLKGVVETLVERLGVAKAKYERVTDNPSFHPGKTAALKVRKDVIGVFGEIHPDIIENYDIDKNCYVAELNMDILCELSNINKKYSALPKYPAVTRDIAVLIDREILVGEIEESIKKAGGNLLESYKLFDVYEGEQIPEGKKSVAYALTYRLADRTLTDKEVNKVHDKIQRSLEHKLGAQLR